MILRRILAALALLCVLSAPTYAQTGSPKTAAQLNAEISTLYPDQNQGAITPFDIRQVSLDMVASGILGQITLTGPVTGTGTNNILTTLGVGAVHSTNLNADVFSTANSWSGIQTFTAGATGLPAPVNPTDAANKQYVDGVAAGIIVLAPTGLATATVLPNSPTYSNGTSGVGATLTAGSNTTLTIDGTVATLNTVVLVKNQSSAFQNGIYTVTTAGSGSAAWVLTRATYFDIASQMKQGSYTFINGGATNLGSSWALAASVTTVGTDPLNWNLFTASLGTITNAQINPGPANTFKGTLNGSATSDITLTACNLAYQVTMWVSGTGWQCGINPVLPSRNVASGLHLGAYNVITTQGYNTPGDGGGATFQNAGTTPFIDVPATNIAIQGANHGSGCTNGTYTGVQNTASSPGHGALYTVGVSGGIVTSVTLTTLGNQYEIGQTLNQGSAFACSVNPVFIITGIGTLVCSFVDGGGINWQMVPDAGGIRDKQCGSVNNWNIVAGDAGSTDDTTAEQGCLYFAADTLQPTVDAGGTSGGKCILSRYGTLVSSLNLPCGVTFEGQGRYSSLLKEADSLSASSHFITAGDVNSHKACFGTQVGKMLWYPGSGMGNSGTYMYYTNSVQQEIAIYEIFTYPGYRGCIWLDTGFGGASSFGVRDTECSVNALANNPAITPGYGAAVQTFRDIIIESGSANSNGFQITSTGGVVDIDGFHSEGVTNPIYINDSGTFAVHVQNATGGSGCTSLVWLDSTGTSGQTLVQSLQPNGCSHTYNNHGSTVGGVVNSAAF